MPSGAQDAKRTVLTGCPASTALPVTRPSRSRSGTFEVVVVCNAHCAATRVVSRVIDDVFKSWVGEQGIAASGSCRRPTWILSDPATRVRLPAGLVTRCRTVRCGPELLLRRSRSLPGLGVLAGVTVTGYSGSGGSESATTPDHRLGLTETAPVRRSERRAAPRRRGSRLLQSATVEGPRSEQSQRPRETWESGQRACSGSSGPASGSSPPAGGGAER